jgi:NADH pyrophosphatase NudC (nudix superfamily)
VAEIGTAQPESVEREVTVEPAPGATGFMQRARLRRRMRFLRRRRELALRELGSFVVKCQRDDPPGEAPLGEKIAAITAIDEEIATLARALDLREEVAVLREPGIASCEQCSTLHDSVARFCPNCGRPT